MNAVTLYMLTDPGGRQKNEDQTAFFTDEQCDRCCCVVADGLGGMGGGAEASACVVASLKQCFETGLMDHDTLPQCLQMAHEALRALQKEMRLVNTMFSTVVLLYLTPERLSWIYSGDTRLYLFDENQVLHCTKDHSVPQMLADCGDISQSEIRHHPDRNRLLYCLGMDREKVRSSAVETAELHAGMSVLLCTDGLWEPVDEADMMETLQNAADVRQWLKSMEHVIRRTPMNEKQDNYTALALWVREE